MTTSDHPAEEPSEPTARPGVLSRLIRFGGLQAANAIAPLLVLPIVISIVGPDGWVGLANGLGVGTAAAVAVALAWPITGPPRVSSATLGEAQDVFREGLVMRAIAYLPVGLLTTLVVIFLTPDGVDVAVPIAMALAMALNGLNSNWYYIGRGEAGGILRFESLPKLAATILTIPAVLSTGLAILYPLLLGIAALGGVVASTWSITRWKGMVSAIKPAIRRLPSSVPLGLAGLLSTGSTALAVPVATLSGAGVGPVGSFAAAVRLRSMAQAGIGAGTSALQSWVSEQGLNVLRLRAKKALLINGSLGLAAGLGVLILAPLIDTLIFGPDVQISLMTASLLGLTCLFYSLSASLTYHILGPLGKSRTVVLATSISSIVSVPLVFFLAQNYGASGATAGVAFAEGLTVTIQSLAARRYLSRPLNA